MSRTYRRKSNKSKNKSLPCVKNLYLMYLNHQHYISINIKQDKRFFTDCQKTPSWSVLYKKENRIFRHSRNSILKKYEMLGEDYFCTIVRRKGLSKWAFYDY